MDVRVPALLVVAPLDFDEGDAAGDGLFPAWPMPEFAKRSEQLVDEVGKRDATVTEREGQEGDGLAVDLVADASADLGGSIVSARNAESIFAFGGGDPEASVVFRIPLDPSTGTAIVPLVKAARRHVRAG